MSRFIPLMIVFWLLSFDTHAAIIGEVVEFGYYHTQGEMVRERNLSTPTGYSRTAEKVNLIKSTEKIPLHKGQLFGFKFRLEGFPKDQVAVDLRIVVIHPEITRPNGSKVSAYQYPVTLDVIGGVVENQSGYKLDHDYELVPGEWRFQYWLKDKMLLEQSFTTVTAVEPAVATQARQKGTKVPVGRKPTTVNIKDTKRSQKSQTDTKITREAGSEKLRPAKTSAVKTNDSKGEKSRPAVKAKTANAKATVPNQLKPSGKIKNPSKTISSTGLESTQVKSADVKNSQQQSVKTEK